MSVPNHQSQGNSSAAISFKLRGQESDEQSFDALKVTETEEERLARELKKAKVSVFIFVFVGS